MAVSEVLLCVTMMVGNCQHVSLLDRLPDFLSHVARNDLGRHEQFACATDLVRVAGCVAMRRMDFIGALARHFVSASLFRGWKSLVQFS